MKVKRKNHDTGSNAFLPTATYMAIQPDAPVKLIKALIRYVVSTTEK